MNPGASWAVGPRRAQSPQDRGNRCELLRPQGSSPVRSWKRSLLFGKGSLCLKLFPNKEPLFKARSAPLSRLPALCRLRLAASGCNQLDALEAGFPALGWAVAAGAPSLRSPKSPGKEPQVPGEGVRRGPRSRAGQRCGPRAGRARCPEPLSPGTCPAGPREGDAWEARGQAALGCAFPR